MEKKDSVLNQILNGLLWFLKSGIWIIILLIGIDALTKWLFEIYLPNTKLTVIPNFFYFRVTHNKGMAWGTLANQTALLATISFVAGALMIAYLVWKWKKLNKVYKACLYLMIAGCYGNFIDRAFYPQGVIDFILFQFGTYEFPTFNLADSFLVVGCLILLIYMLISDILSDKKDRKLSESHVNTAKPTIDSDNVFPSIDEKETKPEENESINLKVEENKSEEIKESNDENKD